MSHAEAADLELPQTLDDWIAPDCHGENFFTLDRSLQSLLPLYMDGALLSHLFGQMNGVAVGDKGQVVAAAGGAGPANLDGAGLGRKCTFRRIESLVLDKDHRVGVIDGASQ